MDWLCYWRHVMSRRGADMKGRAIVESAIAMGIYMVVAGIVFVWWQGLEQLKSRWPVIVVFSLGSIPGVPILRLLWGLVAVPPVLDREAAASIKTLKQQVVRLEDAIPTVKVEPYFEGQNKELFLRVHNCGKRPAKFAGEMMQARYQGRGDVQKFNVLPYSLQWGRDSVLSDQAANWLSIASNSDRVLRIALLGSSSIEGREHLRDTELEAGAQLSFFSAKGEKPPQANADYNTHVDFRVKFSADPSFDGIVERRYRIEIVPEKDTEPRTSWHPKWDAESFEEMGGGVEDV